MRLSKFGAFPFSQPIIPAPWCYDTPQSPSKVRVWALRVLGSRMPSGSIEHYILMPLQFEIIDRLATPKK